MNTLENKDLAIGFFSGNNYSRVLIWIKSLVSSGFLGDIVILTPDCPRLIANRFLENGAAVVYVNTINDGQLVYSQRFFYISQYLIDKNYRYIITTDMLDVLFQSDPIIWIENNIGQNNLISSSESITIKDERWNLYQFIDCYGYDDTKGYVQNEVQNVGIIAGRKEQVQQVCEDIYNISTYLINRTQTPDTVAWAEIVFNRNDIFFANVESGWAVNCGVSLCPQREQEFDRFLLVPKPTINNDSIFNSYMQKPCIVHQYNRNSYLYSIFYKKYLNVVV